MKFYILVILTIVFNLVASSFRRSSRRTQNQLEIYKAACKSLCSSKRAGFLSFSGLKGHLLVNDPEKKKICMCFNKGTPKSNHYCDKDSQKFIYDPKHESHMDSYYQRIKENKNIVEHILD